MLKISVKTSSGEFVESKEYLSRKHLTNSIAKLQLECMQFDLQHYFSNEPFIVAQIGYEFIPQSFTIKNVVAELVVLREELDAGTFYSYWLGPADCLQCTRRYPEKKGVWNMYAVPVTMIASYIVLLVYILRRNWLH